MLGLVPRLKERCGTLIGGMILEPVAPTVVQNKNPVFDSNRIVVQVLVQRYMSPNIIVGKCVGVWSHHIPISIIEV